MHRGPVMKLKQRLFAFQCSGSITLSPRIFWSAFLTKNFPDEKSIPRTFSSAHRDPASPGCPLVAGLLVAQKPLTQSTKVYQILVCVLREDRPGDFVADIPGGQTNTDRVAGCFFTERPKCYEPRKHYESNGPKVDPIAAAEV